MTEFGRGRPDHDAACTESNRERTVACQGANCVMRASEMLVETLVVSSGPAGGQAAPP
ncbi:MAG: hypothetical protein ACK55S_04030 [Planctomycetota bacterium]|jgi:hypothetical protein